MFGLGKDKKQNKEFIFDLEIEIKDPSKGRKLKEYIVSQTKSVKSILRNGQDKEQFNQFGLLLHGYTALQKVISRVQK